MSDPLTDKWRAMAEARKLWPDLSQAEIEAMIGHAVHIDNGVTYVSRMKMPEPFMPNWLEMSNGDMVCPNDDCGALNRVGHDDPRPPTAKTKPYEYEAYRKDEGGYPSAWQGPYNADVRIEYNGTFKTLIGTPVAMQCKECGQHSAILRRDRLHEISRLLLMAINGGTPSDKFTSMMVRRRECERVDCSCINKGAG